MLGVGLDPENRRLLGLKKTVTDTVVNLGLSGWIMGNSVNKSFQSGTRLRPNGEGWVKNVKKSLKANSE